MGSTVRHHVNLRLLLSPVISIIDDALVIVLLVWVLSLLGIKTPWWLIALLAVGFFTWSIIVYRVLVKNPSMGFENMVGRTGITVEPTDRKGMVRIGNELWQAQSDEPIEQGAEIKVVSQNGLKLGVIKKAGHEAREQEQEQ